MRIRCKLLVSFVIACVLLLLFQSRLFALFIALPNLSCPGCNQFEVAYLIHPQQTAHCTYDKPIFLLVLVFSRSDDLKRRMAIRRSWGSISSHEGKSIRTFFACGRTANSTTQNLLEREAEQWQDVLQVFLTDLMYIYMVYIMFCLQFSWCKIHLVLFTCNYQYCK